MKQRITLEDYKLVPEGTIDKIRKWWQPSNGDVVMADVFDEYHEVVVVGNYARDFTGDIKVVEMDVPYGATIWDVPRSQLTPLLTVTQIFDFLRSEGLESRDEEYCNILEYADDIDCMWVSACEWLKRKDMPKEEKDPEPVYHCSVKFLTGEELATLLPGDTLTVLGPYGISVPKEAIGCTVYRSGTLEGKYVRKGDEWVKED